MIQYYSINEENDVVGTEMRNAQNVRTILKGNTDKHIHILKLSYYGSIFNPCNF